MARGFQAREIINLPVEEVWDYLVDWKNASKWMGVQGLQPVSGEPSGEGTRLVFKARGADRESIIKIWRPNEVLALASTQGGICAVYRYQLQSVAGNTMVTIDAQCEASGFLWRALHPIIGYMMKRADGGQLKALKKAIEGANTSN